MTALTLTPAEARVIAALVEKSLTTPQYYPMSANAIMLAANQKTCRFPLTQLTEGEVGGTLNRLEEMKLIARDTFSARVTKWRHAFHHQLMLDAAQMAVLATLMLRGAQTVAELRANSAALKGPVDDTGISAALKDLMERATPMVVQLPRIPGQAATRYAHTLSGEPVNDTPAAGSSAESPRGGDRIAVLEARMASLEAALAELLQRPA